ncbi:sensor domain-containing diguanylate cyclase [Photobacterium sp. TY1-4]|uniref:sensor domain-containing diguanylate cyclase n=1 Tax=Photobacterium sp. TY1-4 TaxID=2899122 RepID=UPI0021BF5DCB|nr:sensor domain-containing diguanylate cyclase [Photobacterium sp. TY1-4]UXI04681.1 sensor domain-containing diguanylate cyclase [Photobacterium sp. TY1-4]
MSKDNEHYLKTELYTLIKQETEIFEFLQAGSLDGLWYWDLEKPDHEWMSPKFWTLLGYDPAEKQHLAAEWQDLIFPEDLQVAINNFEQHCQDPLHPYDQMVRYRHKNGSTVWVRCRGIAIRDPSGKPIRMLGAHNDVTALKQTEEALRQKNLELEQLALRDPLTSLYNRQAFSELLEKELARSIRYQTPFSVAVINIDDFKAVNHHQGYQAGDQMLRSVSEVLLAAARYSDTVARLAGDEFIILMCQASTQESRTAGERYRANIELFLNQQNIKVSIGLTSFTAPSNLCTALLHPLAKELISQATQALDDAKANGKNQVCHFTDRTRSQ